MKALSSELDGCHPLLAVTAEHHISVLGKRSDSTKKNNKKHNEEDSDAPSVPLYREFASLQYNSRPGSSGAFFAKPVNGKPHPDDLPKIGALLDAKNDRMYAVQHANRRLCCWNACEGSGPDEATTLKVELQSPIITLALLSMSKGVVYGTCENGDIFVAAVVSGPGANKKRSMQSKSTGDLELSVDYLSSRQPKGTTHVGTFAEVRLDRTKTSGRKRKMEDVDGSASVTFYQAFCDKESVCVARHVASFSISPSEIGLIKESIVQAVAVVDDLEPNGKQYLANAKLLSSASSSNPRASLVYTVASDDDNLSCYTYCALICLSTASFLRAPLRLPAHTNQFGLVADTILASANNDTIYLHDLETGSFVQKKSVKKITGNMDGGWEMKCDTRTSTISLLYAEKGELHAAFSNATMAPRNDALGQVKIKASSKLTSSQLAARTQAQLFLDDNSNSEIKTLQECARALQNGKNSSPLGKTFDECIGRLQLHGSKDSDEDNVEAHSQKRRTPNGKSKRRKDEDLDALPQTFIDAAIEVVVSIILGERRVKNKKISHLGLDSRNILRRLVRSGRVSARLHFEGSYPLQETNRKHPLVLLLRSISKSSPGSRLSAVQFILEMLQNCHDLSERQLVILMDFMLRYPDPDDIAQAFTESTALQIKQMLKQHSKDYLAVRKENQCGNSTDSSEESEVAIGRKLVVAGIELVLHLILCYSECNEVMLRTALSEGLASSSEAMVLAKLLARTLKLSPSVTPSTQQKNKNIVRTTCLWIACLSDSFEDELKRAKTASGEDYVTYLLDEIQNATRNSQAIISFKDCIGRAEAARKDLQRQTKEDFAETGRWPVDDDLPGYAIDRLVF